METDNRGISRKGNVLEGSMIILQHLPEKEIFLFLDCWWEKLEKKGFSFLFFFSPKEEGFS